LNQDLNSEELKKFQDQLASDDDLLEEVQLQSEMKEFLADSPENALRHNLQKLDAQSRASAPASGPKRFWYLLLLLPLFGGLLWWANTQEPAEPVVIEDPITPTPTEDIQQERTPEEVPAQEKDRPQEADRPEEVTPELMEELETEETAPAPPIAKKKQSTKKKKETPAVQPVEETTAIAANFKPNPSLEFLVANNTRSNELQVDVISAQPNVTLEGPDAFTPMQFRAILNATESLDETTFVLHLFDNDLQRFADFAAVQSFELSLQREDASYTYQVNLSAQVELKPGLYYQVLENYDEERILWVGKFLVQ
ncbi:MAG: hypothetical protein AAFU60_11755, partial [Bacteroidota bacterium]